MHCTARFSRDKSAGQLPMAGRVGRGYSERRRVNDHCLAAVFLIMRTHHLFGILFFTLVCALHAQQAAEPLNPKWCDKLPRPEYKILERVSSPDPWFEVYRIRPGVFAIYEPHQEEEVIS